MISTFDPESYQKKSQACFLFPKLADQKLMKKKKYNTKLPGPPDTYVRTIYEPSNVQFASTIVCCMQDTYRYQTQLGHRPSSQIGYEKEKDHREEDKQRSPKYSCIL